MALADVSSVKMDDIAVLAEQVVLLMVPVSTGFAVPVEQVGLPPQDGIAQGFGQFLLTFGQVGHNYRRLPRIDLICAVVSALLHITQTPSPRSRTCRRTRKPPKP